ncbi:MAG: HEPN domain-containing protein [Candidatus Electrothrix sp. LOE2]|jgi:HEPN domain-containing protein|nr:HEPN domain-containing protein [Candidatus Electrothrix sp. LOE2]
MQDQIENTGKMVQYWLNSADRDQLTMQHLVDTKDYSWALFLGHLVIEKTLKALYVKRLKKHALFSHDLLRLAGKINLTLSDEQEECLDRITTFNINARYDNYKQDFYKLCTEEFTKDWLSKIEELRLWLRNQL